MRRKAAVALLATFILQAGWVTEGMAAVPIAEAAAKEEFAGAVEAPEDMAQQFVAHVNYARVAIAMDDVELAQTHIRIARELVGLLKQENLEQRKVVQVESGRVVYAYDTDYKYHYFPVGGKPVEVQKVAKPFWASSGTLAVTDADVVYLSLDVSGNEAEKGLAKASKALEQDYVSDADRYLAKLTDKVVKVDKKQALPQVVARDNISLARNFLSMENYNGARFALKHAGLALNSLEKKAVDAARKERIVAMRQDIAQLQKDILARDPGLLQKADARMENWWNDLKNWTN